MWFGMAAAIGNTIAAGIVIAEYGGHLFPVLAGNTKIDIISIAIICALGVLQWRGIRWGSGAQLSTAAMKTGAFFILVLACFLLGGPAHKATMQSASSSLPLPAGWPLAIAIILGLQAVIYTIDCWDGVIYFGEEVRNLGRDIQLGIFGSVLSTI